jgi:acetyl-CoA C-acetyltransferase
MGEHTALMATEWGIARAEQDELAVASHHRLAAAYDSGWLDDLVVPFLGLERDQNLRPDSNVERLARLEPVFGGPEGTMTAGNSTPLSDGAYAVLLASEEWAAAREIHEAFAAQVLCTLKAWEDPVFCSQRLGCKQPLGAIDRERLNVHGGSLGAGHPFGATGGRIVAGLAKALHETDAARPARGLISICAAGGLGVTAIMEAP